MDKHQPNDFFHLICFDFSWFHMIFVGLKFNVHLCHGVLQLYIRLTQYCEWTADTTFELSLPARCNGCWHTTPLSPCGDATRMIWTAFAPLTFAKSPVRKQTKLLEKRAFFFPLLRPISLWGSVLTLEASKQMKNIMEHLGSILRRYSH